MSCNCNTSSVTCDPCMFCTPPGVTGLTTCQPPDPCEGYTTDISCVTYTGQDFPCIDVNNGDGLISVLLNILATYFPPEVCCQLEGELSFYTTTTSTTTTSTTTTTTTSTTTTTTSTTTTTTTAAPSTCNCFVIENYNDVVLPFSYVDCNTKQYVNSSVPAATGGGEFPLVPGIVYQCLMTGTLNAPRLVPINTGLCTAECVLPVTTTTTTTSTTVAPTYSRFYEAEIWTCDPCTTDPFGSPIVITVADGYPSLVTNNWYRNVDSLDTNIYRVKNSSPGPYSVVVNFWGYTNCVDACNPPTPEV